MNHTLDISKTLWVKMNYLAKEARQLCVLNPSYPLTENQCFAIGFVSGAPYSVTPAPDERFKVKLALDNISVKWDEDNEKFLVAVLDK